MGVEHTTKRRMFGLLHPKGSTGNGAATLRFIVHP